MFSRIGHTPLLSLFDFTAGMWMQHPILQRALECVIKTQKKRGVRTVPNLLLRKREDPEHINLPSAMMAILSPSRSASSLRQSAILSKHTHTHTSERGSSHEVSGE